MKQSTKPFIREGWLKGEKTPQFVARRRVVTTLFGLKWNRIVPLIRSLLAGVKSYLVTYRVNLGSCSGFRFAGWRDESRFTDPPLHAELPTGGGWLVTTHR